MTEIMKIKNDQQMHKMDLGIDLVKKVSEQHHQKTQTNKQLYADGLKNQLDAKIKKGGNE